MGKENGGRGRMLKTVTIMRESTKTIRSMVLASSLGSRAINIEDATKMMKDMDTVK